LKLVRHEAELQEFVSFLWRKRSSRITVALALEWATRHARQNPAEWAARLSVVRGFARHWSATDPSTEVPPFGLLPYRPARAQPYFYSDHEIRQLLGAAKTRPSTYPLHCWTYYCLFGLLAVTGLRLGEALNLRTEDLDCSPKRKYTKRRPNLSMEDLDASLVGGFLDDLQTRRGNGARSRNLRLTAVRSFFRFAALEAPGHAALIQRVLAIPNQRQVRAMVESGHICATLPLIPMSEW
jgi:site-specific recombinase XerD